MNQAEVVASANQRDEGEKVDHEQEVAERRARVSDGFVAEDAVATGLGVRHASRMTAASLVVEFLEPRGASVADVVRQHVGQTRCTETVLCWLGCVASVETNSGNCHCAEIVIAALCVWDVTKTNFVSCVRAYFQNVKPQASTNSPAARWHIARTRTAGSWNSAAGIPPECTTTRSAACRRRSCPQRARTSLSPPMRRWWGSSRRR